MCAQTRGSCPLGDVHLDGTSLGLILLLGQSCACRTHCLAVWVLRRGICLQSKGEGTVLQALRERGTSATLGGTTRQSSPAVQIRLDARFAASAVPSLAVEPARPARREPTQHIFALCLLAVACKKKRKSPKYHFNNFSPCTQCPDRSRRELYAIMRWLERRIAGTGWFWTRMRGWGSTASEAVLDEADTAMSWRWQVWGGPGHGTVLDMMGRG